jgi:hypothetical protein
VKKVAYEPSRYPGPSPGGASTTHRPWLLEGDENLGGEAVDVGPVSGAEVRSDEFVPVHGIASTAKLGTPCGAERRTRIAAGPNGVAEFSRRSDCPPIPLW